jgi:CheY-like chemotaxis protein
MEALGTMAGHVAHDFNNLLTTILGFAGLLKRSTNMDAEERENLGLIEDAARRAADLTGHLLAFARGGLVRFGAVDLRTVVNDTMRLAEPSLHAALTATTRLPGAPVMVEGDGGQLQHALFNVVSNARDAMPEGGTIEIALSTDGVTATLAIADNGPGMDDETRTRIFEPFYTTKPVGTGTGLGMAITYGIIQGHHGDITVDSRKGKGTTFTITLPLLPGESAAVVTDMFNAGDGNLVLVVDDDEMVRRTTSATLAALGYNVVEAPGGATAVEIVRARPERFSVVLLDLVMPGMTGSETFRALTAIRPDLPVVVCTGYAADAHIDTDVKRRIAGLVQKPFTGERLARALQAAGALPTRRS